MRRDTLVQLAIAFAVLAAAAVFGSIVQSGEVRDGLIRLCSLGLFALSLNLLVGYTGMLSFGHALFYGLGAYVFCVLLRTGAVGIPLATVATLAVAIVVAALIGIICVRLTHVYFAFLTLAIQMLFYSLLIAWSDLTGGEQGLIGGIPKPPFLGYDVSRPVQFFLFNAVVLVGSTLVLHRIVKSPFGAALRMIRDNPQRAAFLGIDLTRTKLAAFVVASAFSALAGVLMGLYVSGAYPNFMYWTTSGEGLFMIMLGGVAVFLGPIFGAGLLIVLEAVINTYSSHHGIVIGLAILATSLGLRKGLLDFAAEAWRRRRERRAGPPEGSTLTANATSIPGPALAPAAVEVGAATSAPAEQRGRQ